MSQEIDIEVIQNEFGKFDISFAENGDFSLTSGFDTAIAMSIFCERRALPNEVPVSSRRRGFWGNVASLLEGFEIGSKIWLVRQERLTEETINKIKDYLNQGLAWFVSEGWAVDVSTSVVAIDGIVRIDVTIERPNGQVETRGYDIWQNT